MERFQLKEGTLVIMPVRDNIVRVIYTKNETILPPSIMLEESAGESVPYEKKEQDEKIIISTAKLKVSVNKNTGICCFSNSVTNKVYLQEAGKSLIPTDVIRYAMSEENAQVKRVKTVDGERNFVENMKLYVDRKAYRGKLMFAWEEEEAIHGLGQFEEGIYDYRHHVQYLYQHNMRIPVPFFVSSRCYGLFMDCGSLMTFNDDENGSYIFMDTIDQMDYYFIAGENLDQIIDGYRYLTGKATMLPRWAFGYMQSKEAYKTGKELMDTAARYRELHVPIDCIIQDWNTWEEGKWGEKILDPVRYPDMEHTLEQLHDMHVHAMISIWPNMDEKGSNHAEMMKAGHMLMDFSTYDAFSKEARKLYWKQLNEGLFSKGFDAWWCDSSEPFSGPDWNGEVKREPWERYLLVGNEHKKFIDPTQANAYSLYHAKGIYENQRNTSQEKRVVNLTRSSYASGQRYGVILWSGDICAGWDVMRKQMIEGLNFSMCGMPYWTMDIGGFFTVGTKWQNRGCGCHTDSTPKWFWNSIYNEGVSDLGYRELYVRWLEMAVFLPIFRSHGTDTPREIWNFGKKGEMFYDAIEKSIQLRYRLLPYIYTLAANVYNKNATIMRSLLFDFMDDPEVKNISDQYMFGPSLLVCPVTEPMYYEAESRPLQKEKLRKCYLPAGTSWYNFHTGEKVEGGQYIQVKTHLDTIPVFVREGSVIPMAEGLSYADEIAEKDIHLVIYPGKDAEFELYEDEGDNYNYEQGKCSRIPLFWSEANQSLTIGERWGEFCGMKEERRFTVQCGQKETLIEYKGKSCTVYI